MLITHLLCAIGTITTAYALPKSARSDYAVKERHIVPRAWTRVGDASKSDMVHLQIGLKQQNEGVVEEHLLQVRSQLQAQSTGCSSQLALLYCNRWP